MEIKYGRRVATNMVVANMIGTGIFTSIGFQVLPAPIGIPDAFSILVIWILGGVLALCGAMSYAEVATTMKESGGEYTFLSRLYHPVIGFTSGWVSMIAGFSAAISALAIAAAKYAMPVFSGITGSKSDPQMVKIISVSFILLVAFIQTGGVKTGGFFQNIITWFKLLLITLILCLPFIGAYLGIETSGSDFLPTSSSLSTIFSLPFAGSLVYVMFSYSGWNASSYIAGNLESPQKNLPFSLITGTLIVVFVYVLMNFVFMNTLSFDELKGQLTIGNLAVCKVFGPAFADAFGFVFAFSLMSGISAMFIAGPRVAAQIGNDFPVFSLLKIKNKSGAPINAIALQALISIGIVCFFDYSVILQYIEITLSLFCLLTVIGVFIIRQKNLADKDTVKTWAYPLTPLLFIGITLWMMTFFIIHEPGRLLGTGITLISGAVLYFVFRKK